MTRRAMNEIEDLGEGDSASEGKLAGTELGGGRYAVGKILARGGIGVVYEGIEKRSGRPVAIKVLSDEYADNPTLLARLEREAMTVTELRHPNIVEVLSFQMPAGESPAFMVMELLRGRALAEELEAEERMSVGKVATIASQVLSALGAAHRASIVHRDVKPGNIWLCGGPRDPIAVKLLDFGLAKLLSASQTMKMLTTKGTLLGTLRYIPPEQIAEKELDGRADLYSLGVVMYRALAGVFPFDGPTMTAVMFSIMRRTPPPLTHLREDVDEALAAVVERAIAREPESRFPDAESMRKSLEPWARGG
jgi:eukaryotic-like serine/threonine-protein kinase